MNEVALVAEGFELQQLQNVILNLFNVADFKKVLFRAGLAEDLGYEVIFKKNMNTEFRLGQNGLQIADLLLVKIHFYF